MGGFFFSWYIFHWQSSDHHRRLSTSNPAFGEFYFQINEEVRRITVLEESTRVILRVIILARYDFMRRLVLWYVSQNFLEIRIIVEYYLYNFECLRVAFSCNAQI